MGVSRRARKRTNRGHSENKDKMWVKKQTKNKQKKHIGALGRSFVPLFRRSVACLYRFFVHSRPPPSSVALRLPVGRFLFFLTFPNLHFPMFALQARLVDIWVGREGRFGFFLRARAVAVFLFYFIFLLIILLPPSSFVFLLLLQISFFLLCIIHHWPILQVPIIYINLLSSPEWVNERMNDQMEGISF